MKLRLLASVVVLLASCVSLEDRSASVECICPVGKPGYHRVFLRAPTGNWGCSAHGGGFYQEVEWLAIRLPDKPASQARYEASQVVIEQGYPSRVIAVTTGFVAIDQNKHEVHVAFETGSGPFWANGVYCAR